MATYERLSGLDACFLGFETPNAYMHVAVTAVFERGPLGRPGGGIDVDRIRQHLATRLAQVPRFRHRLLHLPVLRDAVWVDDDRFDLAHHVHHASLPHPGSTEQLQRRCAEILERPLDRRRPLWEAWVIEGLAGGAFALLVKVHHCIVDGIAGIGMLATLLDVDPMAAPAPRVAWRARPAPSARELLRDELARRARATIDAGRTIGALLADPRAAADGLGATASSLWSLLSTGLSAAPEVCLNRPIGPHREVAWLTLDLAAAKAMARRLGGTLNDVVLTAVSGALGATLRHRADAVPEVPLRAVVPVSVRTAEEYGAPGNRVSLWLVPLPLHETDQRRRFEAIHAATDALKRGGHASGGSVIAEAANWAGGAVVEALARAVGSARLYNVIVTNVPGPAIPLYLAGARMLDAYPHLPLFAQQGIGIALLSYMGRIALCIVADWELADLLRELMPRVGAAFADLAAAAGIPLGPGDAQPAAGTPRGGATKRVAARKRA